MTSRSHRAFESVAIQLSDWKLSFHAASRVFLQPSTEGILRLVDVQLRGVLRNETLFLVIRQR
ncbi:hypothetical protein NKH57_27905, partial [Mesorhizobium sp. M1050]|uniref:hypothetical protein n=1 Tax=Mesorhizobium sp. M1050 TaxID=2957051 RepID=UPI0033360F6F